MLLNTSLQKLLIKLNIINLNNTLNNTKRRVVITGIGAITPLDLDCRSSWQSALDGKSGIGKITHFDAQSAPVQIAGEVHGFDVTKNIGPYTPLPGVTITQAANLKEARRVGRFCNLALGAGLEAYGDSGLDAIREKADPLRMGVNIGVGMGGLPEIAEVHSALLTKGYKRVTPFFIPQVIPNMPSGQLSILLNFKGPNLCNVTACASSAHSLGEAFRLIQRGQADVMLAGGAEAVICPLGVAGFASMKALSTRNEDPEKASRPFDRDRDGFVMGEGAGALILEEYEFARSRSARIYAEIVGYGLSGDAYHMTAPSPDGEGAERAIRLALEDSNLSAEKIGYINAHGTSTPSGDTEEAKAIARVFASYRDKVHVSSTKSMTGHLLGAAGAVEAIFCICALVDGKIPPTINLDNLDPACEQTELNFTPHHMVEKNILYAMSNSFGFGGTNACLVFGKI
ncbi:MAG: beta-ketoacyl-ACP synthase II [Deltaproteobacteria bacterium]|nr:beta-ketoacyl-ACP synthase II [Deltaproteobacteria bacterium]